MHFLWLVSFPFIYLTKTSKTKHNVGKFVWGLVERPHTCLHDYSFELVSGTMFTLCKWLTQCSISNLCCFWQVNHSTEWRECCADDMRDQKHAHFLPECEHKWRNFPPAVWNKLMWWQLIYEQCSYAFEWSIDSMIIHRLFITFGSVPFHENQLWFTWFDFNSTILIDSILIHLVIFQL